MTIALIILISVAVYVMVGWAAAVQRMPRAWRRARAHWRGSPTDGSWEREQYAEWTRENVRMSTAIMFTCWPIAFPLTFINDYFEAHPPKDAFNRFIDAHDPQRDEPCPRQPEPVTLSQPKEPSHDSSIVTSLLSGLTRSASSKKH